MSNLNISIDLWLDFLKKKKMDVLLDFKILFFKEIGPAK